VFENRELRRMFGRWGRKKKCLEVLVRNIGGWDAEGAVAISAKRSQFFIFCRVDNNSFTASSKQFVISIIKPYVIEACVPKT
jgi:hypothetical protein